MSDGTPPRRILVVDDTDEIADLTHLVLESAGYRVRTARNGGEALRRVAEERPDLILMDINMPDMDGWETLRLLQVQEGGPPPVVMFSVKLQVHDKVQALQEGAMDYIVKPFSPEELLARVERILARIEVTP